LPLLCIFSVACTPHRDPGIGAGFSDDFERSRLGDDRSQGKPRKVQIGKTYRFRIERIGGTLSVWVDQDFLVEMDDPAPLAGRGHDHFGFNNWQSDLWFDNLKLTPL